MIVKDLEIKGFRGLRQATLGDFAKVNIFVGRNGSGKSSILESLYLALVLNKGLGYIVRRRGWFGLASVEALFYEGVGEATISTTLWYDSREDVRMRITAPTAEHLEALRLRGLDVANMRAIALSAKGEVVKDVLFYVDVNGKYHSVIIKEEGEEVVNDASFIDWNSVYEYGSPEDVYSNMMIVGGDKAKRVVIEALRAEFEELHDIAVLRTGDRWVLHFVLSERSIPYYVVGDGIRYALMYLMTTATWEGRVLLMEEPELHTHPSLMRIVGRAILSSYKERLNQVFISTHSLELIEAILEEAEKLGLGDDELKIYRLSLTKGELKSEVYTLSEAREAVSKIGWDLRR